jgi:hypothetical protein
MGFHDRHDAAVQRATRCRKHSRLGNNIKAICLAAVQAIRQNK